MRRNPYWWRQPLDCSFNPGDPSKSVLSTVLKVSAEQVNSGNYDAGGDGELAARNPV